MMVGFGLTEVDHEARITLTAECWVRLVCVGDAITGKSAAIDRFVYDCFDPKYLPTGGIQFSHKTAQMGGDLVKFQICDTSVGIGFPPYGDAHGIFIFFDLTSKESFEAVRKLKKDIDKREVKDVSVILVGTKSDLESREVWNKDIVQLSEELDVEYFEISNKTGHGVNRIFERMLEKIQLVDKENQKKMSSAAGNSVATDVGPGKKSKSCTIL